MSSITTQTVQKPHISSVTVDLNCKNNYIGEVFFILFGHIGRDEGEGGGRGFGVNEKSKV